jgi:hypothetical protein
MPLNTSSTAADQEQIEQENQIWPWLADDSMADSAEDSSSFGWADDE